MEIFDRTVTPYAVGAGIGVQPIGLTALKKLGLLEDVLAHGARIEAIRTWVKNDCATEGVWAGRRCLDIEYSRYDPRLFGVGLARGVLFESLLGTCRRQEGVTTRFGVTVEHLEQGADTVHLRDSKNLRHGPYDLVVIAAGTRANALRDQLGLRSWFKQYSYGALFALVPDEDHIFGRTLHQVHAGPGCHTTLGFLPTGLPSHGGIDTVGDGHADKPARSVATLYYNLREDEYAAWRQGGLERWKTECMELMPHAAGVIEEGVVSQEQVAFARYSDGGMWRYNNGRCVVIGVRNNGGKRLGSHAH